MPIEFNPFVDEPIRAPIGPDGDANDVVLQAIRELEERNRQRREQEGIPVPAGRVFIDLEQLRNPAGGGRRGAQIEFPPTMKPRKTGVELFKLLLSAVREVYDVDGFVAGGAVRDTGLGVPYKDVDLFLPLTMKEFEPHVEELGWTPQGRMADKDYLGGKTERYRCVSNDQPIDIVLYGKMEDPVASFPCHWTRVKYVLDGGLVTTPEFDKDMKNKTCTMIDGLDEKQREVFVKKFTQWTQRTGLKDWTLEVAGLDKGWFTKYNAERALRMAKKKTKNVFTTTTTDAQFWGPMR